MKGPSTDDGKVSFWLFDLADGNELAVMCSDGEQPYFITCAGSAADVASAYVRFHDDAAGFSHSR